MIFSFLFYFTIKRETGILFAFLTPNSNTCVPQAYTTVYPREEVGITIFTKSFLVTRGDGDKIAHA